MDTAYYIIYAGGGVFVFVLIILIICVFIIKWKKQRAKSKAFIFKKIHHDAQIPNRGHATDAGYDLYTCETVTLKPKEGSSIKTNISVVKWPPKYHLEIFSRRSTFNQGIYVQSGVINNGSMEVCQILRGLISYEYSPYI